MDKFVFIGLAIVIMALLFLVAQFNDARWEAFKTKMNCRVVAHERSSLGVGITTNGQATTMIISGKTGWYCDDGITYWR